MRVNAVMCRGDRYVRKFFGIMYVSNLPRLPTCGQAVTPSNFRWWFNPEANRNGVNKPIRINTPTPVSKIVSIPILKLPSIKFYFNHSPFISSL